MPSDARERMVVSAAQLMRERGVQATAFSDVLEHSGAPRGSIYHHFPGGKAQLVEEATAFAGRFIAAGLAEALADGDPVAAVERFAGQWRRALRRSDYTEGCPVVAATLAAEQVPAARDRAAEAFEAWIAHLRDALVDAGAPADRAASVATLVISSIEGAIVLSRAPRSTEPLERTAGELARLVAGALA